MAVVQPEDDAPLTATIAEDLEAGEEPTASPDPVAVEEQESHVEAKAAPGDAAVMADGDVTMDAPAEATEVATGAESKTVKKRKVKA